MTLNQKQADFAYHIAQLIVWGREEAGIHVMGAEWFRPPELATLYAKQGKGIRNSNHTKKLALDMFVVENGRVTWRPQPYNILGAQWKTMHPSARWGGDFISRDRVHFSFEHNGVR